MTGLAPTPPSPGAIRQRRYHERRRNGARYARILFTKEAIHALNENGFLPAAAHTDMDFQIAIYHLINSWLELTRKRGMR
jgi:hypothetical protein